MKDIAVFGGEYSNMNAKIKQALDVIDEKQELICKLSDKIWEYAELSLMEEKSAALYTEILEKEGFLVKKGIYGMPTAFCASFGSGSPKLGILAEYDALSGLSQKGAVTEQIPVTEGAPGHGCGHNMLGAGAFAAALSIKAYLEENKLPGTVVLYGCPGEEAAASKAFMAREGVWKELDAAVTWHPDDSNEVVRGSSNACIQNLYTFYGRASHASGAPEMGRSALDAVELMNIGVQFLREHMPDKARVHYAITDAGGVSPNVVQPKASVLYFVRSDTIQGAMELQKRVDDIAKGAALMTETVYKKEFIDGLSNEVPNDVLGKIMQECLFELGAPQYSEEELEYARKIQDTYEKPDKPCGLGSSDNPIYRDKVKKLMEKSEGVMNSFILPFYEGEPFRAGSSDVGDVSWLTPTVQVHIAAWPDGCPGHSWQNVSCGASSIGKKAVLHAGKVMALTAIRLLNEPSLLEEAKAEFKVRTEAGYTCPIPEGAVPRSL